MTCNKWKRKLGTPKKHAAATVITPPAISTAQNRRQHFAALHDADAAMLSETAQRADQLTQGDLLVRRRSFDLAGVLPHLRYQNASLWRQHVVIERRKFVSIAFFAYCNVRTLI